VVILGGGVAGLETLLALRDLAGDRVDIELVAPEPHFWYRPLAVVEPFEPTRAPHFELGAIADELGARFTLGAADSVDVDARVLRTSASAEIAYDFLVLAAGARPEPALDHAFTFRGPADAEGFYTLLHEAAAGAFESLLFAVPSGTAWPLPLYKLALQTSAFLRERTCTISLTFVTPEPHPLAIFGAEASGAIERLLEENELVLYTERHAAAAEHGVLLLAPEGRIPFDRLVALPRLRGATVRGIPQDAHGFVPTDQNGLVHGLDDVYAAGDITTFPVKQDGIATQQADAVAAAIARLAGASVDPAPFRPVLRGLLLTGGSPAYLRAELSGGRGLASKANAEPLWWPPGKIVGRYPAPFSAARATLPRPPAGAGTVPVEVELSSPGIGSPLVLGATSRLFAAASGLSR
jgi:sulfide:quinone oxidoreductase